jgi:peptidoglycan-N-acetylglucosamine deacetylase
MYLVKTPQVVQSLFSDFVWSIPTERKEIFLTFDDGPIPEVTPWVLDVLNDYGFKATFFCVGDNIRKFPEIYDRILDEGHAVGNHTFNHLNGWTTDQETYLENVKKCDGMVSSDLFRPPYGKLRRSQSQVLKLIKTVVMWDVLSGDFDTSISNEKCLSNVMDNYSKGSIIVFHDSLKAEDKLRYVLPKFLEHLSANGFISKSLEASVYEYA